MFSVASNPDNEAQWLMTRIIQEGGKIEAFLNNIQPYLNEQNHPEKDLNTKLCLIEERYQMLATLEHALNNTTHPDLLLFSELRRPYFKTKKLELLETKDVLEFYKKTQKGGRYV